jgi:hypothetical protein
MLARVLAGLLGVAKNFGKSPSANRSQSPTVYGPVSFTQSTFVVPLSAASAHRTEERSRTDEWKIPPMERPGNLASDLAQTTCRSRSPGTLELSVWMTKELLKLTRKQKASF